MPRKPTGRPRGRPKGTGRLSPQQTVEEGQVRVSLRLPTALYDRLEAFAAGRHFHRGSPQLARCIRDVLTAYLDQQKNRQSENGLHRVKDNSWPSDNESTWQTGNGPQVPVQAEVQYHTTDDQGIAFRPVSPQALGAGVAEDLQPPQFVIDYDPHKFLLGAGCKRGHLSHGAAGNLRTIAAGLCVACGREKHAARTKGQPQAKERAHG